MSRIGRQPIVIPRGVRIKLTDRRVNVHGPLGELEYDLPKELRLHLEDSTLQILLAQEHSAKAASLWGLWRSLLANAVVGVKDGFKKQLELVGVGYRGQLKGERLELQLGFSHPVKYQPPEGIKLSLENNRITVEGIDKQRVGQVAAEIRALRPPDPYKGKGVRYLGEVLHLKPGKAAKAVAGE